MDAPSGPAADPEGQQEVLESDPGGNGPDGLAGEMGTSSERVGRLRGSDVEATHGVADTSETPGPEDGPPEQSADPRVGGPETPTPEDPADYRKHPHDPEGAVQQNP